VISALLSLSLAACSGAAPLPSPYDTDALAEDSDGLWSGGRDPAGDVALNEVMSDNASSATDEVGDYEDWLELHNRGDGEAAIGGWLLTDDISLSVAWALPAGVVIPAGGFLVIWADDDVGEGPLHADFKLSSEGERVTLLAPDWRIEDAVQLPELEDDQVFAREHDGDGDWRVAPGATPGRSNQSLPEL